MASIQLTRGTLYRVLLLATAIGGVWWWNRQAPPPPEAPVVAVADRAAPVPLRLLVSAGGTYRCERSRCASTPTVAASGVTDGQWWYYYDEENPASAEASAGRQESSKKYLRRQNNGGETQTITESTPLTSPRGLFMSPNGRQVAFWLDNIDEPERELTELWAYDADDGGIRLLAETIYRPDARSDVFWNSEGTYLWFVADTAPQSEARDRLELILINAASPGKRAAFPEASWSTLLGDLPAAHVDLSQRGDHLAYAASGFLGNPILMVHGPDGAQRTSIRGEVLYTQWLEDTSLLYALQDTQGFTFWRVSDGLHRFIARRPGQLLAARSDPSGQHIVFATDTTEAIHLSSLAIQSGVVAEEGVVPVTAAAVTIASVEQLPGEAAPAGAATTLDDAELAAFVDTHFAAITGDPGSQPLRLVITEEANVLLLDYRQAGGREGRLQVKVEDAINTEWSIRARYEPVNREWRKVEGGAMADPAPLRLYEWETSLKQWILKENL